MLQTIHNAFKEDHRQMFNLSLMMHALGAIIDLLHNSKDDTCKDAAFDAACAILQNAKSTNKQQITSDA